jgi:hypothetical protein
MAEAHAHGEAERLQGFDRLLIELETRGSRSLSLEVGNTGLRSSSNCNLLLHGELQNCGALSGTQMCK